MDMKALEKLIAMLPDGSKKDSLIQKMQRLNTKQKKRGGDGLQDSFELKPTGHIKIEAIDDQGNVVGVLADKKNLVVNGAEEILLRAFAGDTSRILYKNRIPKSSSGVTGKFHISDKTLQNKPLFDGAQLLHAPNLLWAEVEDEQFEVSYGYYPITLYVKEESPEEAGKKAFSFSKVAETGRTPIGSEIYSGYTNLFMGIGEGKNYSVPLNDNRLTLSAGFTASSDSAVTKTEGDSLSFTQKVSNFQLDLNFSNKGAQVDVFINNVLKETIETFDSSLAEPEVHSFLYEDLNLEADTIVRIVHSGADESVTDAEMSIAGLHFDALSKNMNGLIQEFKTFEKDFTTPEICNTTPTVPFTIQLENFPVRSGSVKVKYEEIDFVEVSKTADLTDIGYVVDYKNGVIEFNRALTGVLVTYGITNESHESKLTSTLPASEVSWTETTPISTPVVGEVVTSSQISGASSNKTIYVSKKQFIAGTLIVRRNGSPVSMGTSTSFVTSVNPATGAVVFLNTPQASDNLTFDYSYNNYPVHTTPVFEYITKYVMDPATIVLKDQNGNALTLQSDVKQFGPGNYSLDADNKFIKIAKKAANGVDITSFELSYTAPDKKGIPTGYTRAVVEKPKSQNAYPWFELDKGSVRFVAEFPELKPAYNVIIREMAMFDGPRVDDNIPGFRNYPVKAFSLVRVNDVRKDKNTGIRITWTITLLNEAGQAFKGGKI